LQINQFNHKSDHSYFGQSKVISFEVGFDQLINLVLLNYLALTQLGLPCSSVDQITA